jgi:HD-like signal output (HDOD) protein
MGSGESKANSVVSVEADCLARASAASPRLPPVVAKIIALMQSSENQGISVELAKLTHDIVEDGG